MNFYLFVKTHLKLHFYFKIFLFFLGSLGEFIENCVYFFLIDKSQRSAMKGRLGKIFPLSSLLLAKILIILVFQTRNSAINTYHITDCQQLNLYLVDENLDFRAFNSSKFHKYKTVLQPPSTQRVPRAPTAGSSQCHIKFALGTRFLEPAALRKGSQSSSS
jgi:hypothetical protein